MARFVVHSSLLSALFLVGFAVAQDLPGIPQFSTVQNGSVDTINLASGNILIRIPVRSKGAGPIPFVSYLSMNSSAQWEFYPPKWTINPQLIASSNLSGTVNKFSYADTCDDGSNTTVYYDWSFTDPNGTIHTFNSIEAIPRLAYLQERRPVRPTIILAIS